MKSFKYLFIFTIFLTTALIADHNNNSCPPKPECECPPCGCEAPKNPTISAYNFPARVDVCGSYDFFVTGSYIYWKPYEEQLLLVRFDDVNDNQELNYMKFQHKSGFKVGAGYNFSYDNWTAYLEYIRFHATNTTSFSTLPPWADSAVFYWADLTNFSPLKTSLNIDLDMLDLEFSRWEYRGKCLTFNPFFGLKGGFLDQSFRYKKDNLNGLTTAKSDSKFIGLRTGIYSDWKLCYGFSFFGKNALSLVYQKIYNIKAIVPSSDILSIERFMSTSQYNVAPIVELIIGAKWQSYFYKNNYHFDVSAGYELQYFWDQNYMWKIFNAQNLNSGSLNFQGLNVRASFDF